MTRYMLSMQTVIFSNSIVHKTTIYKVLHTLSKNNVRVSGMCSRHVLNRIANSKTKDIKGIMVL